MVTCHSRGEIEAGFVSADALISITGTTDKPAAVNAAQFGDNLLRLTFDDIPWASWRGGPYNELFAGATQEQVAEAMAFGRLFSCHIGIHCQEGQSRSTAIALAIIADRCGDAQGAVQQLLQTADELPSSTPPDRETGPDGARVVLEERPMPRRRPRIHPNPGVVRHAENLLGMAGQLDAALLAECSDYKWWRAQWVAEGWS